MKPVIGLIPLYDDDKDSFWMLPGYMKAVDVCGGLPLMLPLTEDQTVLSAAFDLCSGILFTGGHDVSPSLYGEEARDCCGIVCFPRDRMEAYLLGRCLEEDKPLLGICRGLQFMNACLGGTLYQDLPAEYKSGVVHRMKPPYDRAAHQVEVLPDTLLAALIGAGVHAVNSCHHQAVRKLSSRLDTMAVSEDGLVEAACVKGQKFALGVQWHPEFSYKTAPDSLKIIQAFIDVCI